ncbi:hypothetical protein MIMGU_mgv1a014830mg [Erythranthe guttata]|uniref:Thioredoxin domain-containing protein n=1 Tax=Erythranthe guttata TaxID=4155 RepID=A0A022R731_ERYGU|nr:hypothetical protein MIMGU_mgv1a014830mg [Erythranthe guttata]
MDLEMLMHSMKNCIVFRTHLRFCTILFNFDFLKTMGSIVSSLLGGGEAAAAAESSGADPSGPSRVTAFHSSQRWQLHFNSAKQLNKLMVIDFSATWCGPCKFMEPVFNDMSAQYTDVDFIKIDVDELAVRFLSHFWLICVGCGA